MIKTLKELIQWLKEYKEWYDANYGNPSTQDGPGENPPPPPPKPPFGNG